MPKLTHTYIGFDYGSKSIGLAVGQAITLSANPIGAVSSQNGQPNWSEIAKLIKPWAPSALIVGIPYKMDGSSFAVTEQAKKFVAALKQQFDLPIYTTDERLTTKAARTEIYGSKGYRGLTKANVDAYSAKLILENWLQANLS